MICGTCLGGVGTSSSYQERPKVVNFTSFLPKLADDLLHFRCYCSERGHNRLGPQPSGKGTENTNRQGITNSQNIGVNDDPFVHRFLFS